MEIVAGEVVCNARTGVRRQRGWTCTYIEEACNDCGGGELSIHGPRTPASSHEPEATVHRTTSVPRIGTENEGVVPSWHECEK